MTELNIIFTSLSFMRTIAGFFAILILSLSACAVEQAVYPIPAGEWDVNPQLACPGELINFKWTELQDTTDAKIVTRNQNSDRSVNMAVLNSSQRFIETDTFEFHAKNDNNSYRPLPVHFEESLFALDPSEHLTEITVTNGEDLPWQTIIARAEQGEENSDWPGGYSCVWTADVPSSYVSRRIRIIAIRNEMNFRIDILHLPAYQFSPLPITRGFTLNLAPFPDLIDGEDPTEYYSINHSNISGHWLVLPGNEPGNIKLFDEIQTYIDSNPQKTNCAGFEIKISVRLACTE